MEKEFLEDFYKNKTKIKLILKDKDMFTGIITNLSENTLEFFDKFSKKVTISLDSISRAIELEDRE